MGDTSGQNCSELGPETNAQRKFQKGVKSGARDGNRTTSEAWEAYLKARKRLNWPHLYVLRCSSNGFQLEQRKDDDG